MQKIAVRGGDDFFPTSEKKCFHKRSKSETGTPKKNWKEMPPEWRKSLIFWRYRMLCVPTERASGPPHLPLYLLHYLALYPRTAPTAVCMCTYCCTRFLLLLKFHRIIYVLFCVRTDEDIPGESDILSPGETTILYPRENWCKRVLHVVPGTYYCYLL